MKSSAKKVELASVDDLFSTEESRTDAQREKVVEIPLSELHPFKGHPFKVKDDEAMMETADSIKQYGVLVPAIARPDPEGGYELVAGHRRHRASELAEKETMPVIVRDLDDDAATIIMVDSNLQRESLLPSERAFAYKMKLDAMKHQGERVDLTSSQVGTKLRADEILAQQAGSSRNQVQRYIRLTELIPELMDMVDEKKIALNPAYELSFLKKEEQVDLLDAMDSEQATPSLSQAQRLKKYSQEGHLTLDMMRVIMGEEKKSDLDRVTFTSDTLRKYFPKSYTPQRMQETIIKLLEAWQKKRQRDVVKRDAPHPQSPDRKISMTFIPEGDLYRLIVHSKLPSAEQFEQWVFDEVLPTIRKHGAYLTREKLWEVATSPEALMKLCSDLLAEREANISLRKENAQLEGKAAFYDLFIDLKHSTNLRTTAKELDVPERRFVRFLIERRFVYRTASGNVLPYANVKNTGLFCVKDYCNHGHTGSYTLVTPKGKLYFAQLREMILLVS